MLFTPYQLDSTPVLSNATAVGILIVPIPLIIGTDMPWRAEMNLKSLPSSLFDPNWAGHLSDTGPYGVWMRDLIG